MNENSTPYLDTMGLWNQLHWQAACFIFFVGNCGTGGANHERKIKTCEEKEVIKFCFPEKLIFPVDNVQNEFGGCLEKEKCLVVAGKVWFSRPRKICLGDKGVFEGKWKAEWGRRKNWFLNEIKSLKYEYRNRFQNMVILEDRLMAANLTPTFIVAKMAHKIRLFYVSSCLYAEFSIVEIDKQYT